MKEISEETRWYRAQLIWLFYLVAIVTGSVIVYTLHMLPGDASLWFIVPLSMILCVSYFAKISAFVASYAFQIGNSAKVLSHHKRQGRLFIVWFVLSLISFVVLRMQLDDYYHYMNSIHHHDYSYNTEAIMLLSIAFLAVQLIFFMVSVHGYLRARDCIGLGKQT
jgi:hypothetical protein